MTRRSWLLRFGVSLVVFIQLKWDYLWVYPKSVTSWDGIEERFRRRLAMWKRFYVSKGGRTTLIRSTMASLPIYFVPISYP